MSTIRIPTGTIEYQDAPFVMPEGMPERSYVDVRVELTSEQAADIRRQRETLSAGYAVAGRRETSGLDTVGIMRALVCEPAAADLCARDDRARPKHIRRLRGLGGIAIYDEAAFDRSGKPPNADCAAGAPFVLDAKDMERGGLYSEPLAAIGPVQSGTLREVKR